MEAIMLAFEKVICIIVLSIVAIRSNEPEFESFYRKVVPPEEYPITFIDGFGLENVTLWFVSCKRPHEKNMKCVLDFYNESTFGPNEQHKKCSFQLKLLADETKIYLRALRLGLNKFLISWIEYNFHPGKTPERAAEVNTFVRFVTIRFPECNSTNQFQTTAVSIKMRDYVDFQTTLSIYLEEDSFSVIYQLSNRSFVQESFDSEGRRLRGPVGESNFSIGGGAVSVAAYPLSDENLIRSQERFRISQNFCGTSFPCRGLVTTDKSESWTTSNGNVTHCKSSEEDLKKWECTSLHGRNASEFHLTFAYEPKASIIYNMPDGSPLAVTIEEILVNTAVTIYVIHLRKFGDHGEIYDPIEYMRFEERPDVLLGHFFQHSANAFCLASLSMKQRNRYHNIKCYSKRSLMKTQ